MPADTELQYVKFVPNVITAACVVGVQMNIHFVEFNCEVTVYNLRIRCRVGGNRHCEGVF